MGSEARGVPEEKARPQDAYEILSMGDIKVSRKSTHAELRKAYHKLALRYHPDRARVSSKMSTLVTFAVISDAWTKLKDPTSRMLYDIAGDEGLAMYNELVYERKVPRDLAKIGVVRGRQTNVTREKRESVRESTSSVSFDPLCSRRPAPNSALR